jgi:hypothetical protein
MNTGILVATVLVELCLGVLGFISMHLRFEAKRRRLSNLPRWPRVTVLSDPPRTRKTSSRNSGVPRSRLK